MIPKIFAKEHGYVPFPPFGIPTVAGLVPPALVRADFPSDPSGMPPNASLETVLQNHRRKMLRRAANRRSAQLSRARKKAHLEDLKTENARLQRLVDVLDSQPELVFCVTASGKITYVSERTMGFIKVNFAGEDSDDDPTHISQILSKESVVEVLEVINKLREHSINRSENDLNMLFSVKMVNFHDAVGHPIVGYLRCSKVNRRASIQDLPVSEPMEKSTPTPPPPSQQQPGPPAKKLKTSKNSSVPKSNGTTSTGKEIVEESAAMMAGNPKWNLTNFKLLADCVTSITEGKDLSRDSPPSSSDNSGPSGKQNGESSSSAGSGSGDGSAMKSNENSSSGSLTTHSVATSSTKSKSDPGTTSPSPIDGEEEFVCVIRTSEDCFVPYRSNKDILMFSSALSAASIEAHNDFELRATPSDRQAKRRSGSPVESNNSSSANSMELKTASDSSGQLKNGTSSETGSEEDNNGELDSN